MLLTQGGVKVYFKIENANVMSFSFNGSRSAKKHCRIPTTAYLLQQTPHKILNNFPNKKTYLNP
jgi:hypothetical protein